MSELLLCDPMLSWLEPIDLLRVKGLNRLSREKISQHMTTQRCFSTHKTTLLHWNAREKLYAMYPNVESLTILCDGVHRPREYLRDSTKSLHLLLPLTIGIHSSIAGMLKYPYLENTVHLVEALDQVFEFLQSNPSCALENLQISFDPTVSISFEIPNGLHTGYDSYGPLYDDLQCYYKTKKYPPERYLCVLEDSTQKLQDAVKRLLTHHLWASTQVPQELLNDTKDRATQTTLYEYLSKVMSRKI
jgi:hypothetical protein